MKKQRLAFLGTGIMGRSMCEHLLGAGYEVHVWNRTSCKVLPLIKSGAVQADSAAEAVDGADVVVIMLSSGPVVSDVLFGRTMGDSVADRLRPGSTVVVMSSIPVETAKDHAARLLEREVMYVDAPVSGGEKGAVEACLTIMAGGEETAVTHVKKILTAMGNVTHVGPVGCGQLAKLANQTIVGITIDAVAEAFLLVEAGGADVAAVREALLGGFADSTILRQHGKRMIEREFKPGAKAEIQLKDLRTSRVLADSLGLNLPVLRLTESLYKRMCNDGSAELDHSALYEFLRK
jgi:3-hydroxyisobutyrate dehydrogenase-like beta-hydroxyacid dehydrogenase